MAMHLFGQLAEKMRSGGAVVGTWLTIPDPIVAEAIGQADFDFVLVDGEHGPAHPDTLPNLLPVLDLCRRPMMYRVRANRADLIAAALDGGASAIMVPMVETAEEAARAVGAAKYPPAGRRGFGPWRASSYYADMAEYLEKADAATALILQIESEAAVENVEAILATPGCDGLFVGPGDLALSMGLKVGEPHPALDEAFRTIGEAGARLGKIIGTDIASPDQAAKFWNLGFRLFAFGGDLTYLTAGSQEASGTIRNAVARLQTA